MSRDYGYPMEWRYRILCHANLLGVSSAAKRYNVAMWTIYNWRKRLL